LTSLVEGVKTVLLVTLVERVVDNGASSTGTKLLESSVGRTSSAGNEGNDTNNNTSDDTSSKNSGGNDGRSNSASLSGLHALSLLLDAGDSTAVSLSACSAGGRVVAIQRLVIATLEGDANSDSAEETVIGARDGLRNATSKGAMIIHARILEVASDVIGSVRASTSLRVAGVIGTTDAVVAFVFSSIASTGHVVANGRDAEVRRVADDRSVRAGTIGAGINGAGIAVVAILRGALATKDRVAGRSEARIRGSAISVQSLAMVIGRRGTSAEAGRATVVIGTAINRA